MSPKNVFVALQQFCELEDRPRRLLIEAGFELHENTSGRRLRREELPTMLRDADAVLAGVEPYDDEVLSSLPRLRCISRCGAGTDSIDLGAAHRYKIAVLTTTNEVVEPVAQMTVAMILALARNLSLHVKDFSQGHWRKHTGCLLSEWTIGLVGFGRIGRAVEHHLRTFGAKILVTDPRVNTEELPSGVRGCDLSTLLAEADCVSLHAGRRPEDGFLIGQKELACMKRGSRLVNTARGYLVDEVALQGALESGHLAAFATDVFQTEPYQGALLKFPQVLATPHIASLTKRSRVDMELRCAKNVVDFFAESRKS